MTKHNKIIGILGGMGPEAGCILHQYINHAAKQLLKTEKDEDYPNVIHFAMPSTISDRTDFLLGITEENPAEAVAHIAKMLSMIAQEMDTTIVSCVACNAFHSRPIWDYFYTQVQTLTNLSFVHLVDSTIEAIQEELPPPAKIAIFATTGLNKEKLYESKLAPLGYEILSLTPEQQQDVHHAIYDHEYGLKANSQNTEKACILLQGIVQSLKDQGVNKIIFGCTELSIAFPAGSDSIFVDPMMIVAKKLVRLSAE